MKTIHEICVEQSIGRSTVLKAAQRGAIPARQSGDIWLIDDESEDFLAWLGSRKRQTKPMTTYYSDGNQSITVINSIISASDGTPDLVGRPVTALRGLGFKLVKGPSRR